MNFYNRFIELCAKANVSASFVAQKVGLSRASAFGWKNGALPSDVNLQKIADYFDVSVEYLKGKTENPSTERGKGDIKNWTVYTMGGDKPVDSVPVNVGSLEYIQELVEITRTLPQEKIKALLEVAKLMQ